MQMLYDSDNFVVVHMDANAPPEGMISTVGRRDGFEIVDKRRNMELYLDGHWAEMFNAQIKAWQENTPTQDEVEETLEGYAQLAHTPLIMH